jgi:hypothetical protein
MLAKMNQKGIRQWTFFLIISVIGLCWCAAVHADKIKGGDSPQAVFKAARAAGADKDFNALAKLTALSERPMLAFGTDMGVGMFVEFYEGENAEALRKEYQEIQNRYGIKTESEDEGEKLHISQDTSQEVIDAHMRKRAEKLYGNVDVVKYVPELMGIVIKMPEMAEQSFVPQEELSNLKIDGDNARGKAGDKNIAFIREGDRWYLTADIMN